MDDHFRDVAAAFSRKAPLYDAFGHGHENLARMREKVYAHIGALLHLVAGCSNSTRAPGWMLPRWCAAAIACTLPTCRRV